MLNMNDHVHDALNNDILNFTHIETQSTLSNNEMQLLEGRYKAGRIAARCLQLAIQISKPGVKTIDIDTECHKFITANGGTAECIGYQGYQHASCISVNDVVCHGIPGNYKLKDGDIVNVDIVVRYKGHLADTSTTILVGDTVSDSYKELVYHAKNAMYAGMHAAKQAGCHHIAQLKQNSIPAKDIGNGIHEYIEQVNQQKTIQKYSLIRDLCSHCIGPALHVEPIIHNCKNDAKSIIPVLQCFTVEPIVKIAGKSLMIYTEPDQWTMRSKDGAASTQFEHTMCLDSLGNLHIFTTLDDAEEQKILAILETESFKKDVLTFVD